MVDEDDIRKLKEPTSWIRGYLSEVLLGGESILPYICEMENNMGDLYEGIETECPICGGRIKHQYTGNVTMEQLNEDLHTCLWMKVTDESRSCLGFTPICRGKDIKKD